MIPTISMMKYPFKRFSQNIITPKAYRMFQFCSNKINEPLNPKADEE